MHSGRLDSKKLQAQAGRGLETTPIKNSPKRLATAKDKNTNTSESWGTHDSGLSRGDFMDEEMAPFSALSNDMMELKARLHKAEIEKEALKCQLHEALDERERAQRRLEAVGAAHESRITEMHCVIVELNKKLKTQQNNAIIEESEGSVSELSFQEGSVYNSDIEGEREHEEEEDDPEANVPHNRVVTDTLNIAAISNKSTSPCSLPPLATSMHVQALQEEIMHLRAQVALLQSQLAASRAGIVDLEPGADEKSNYTSDDLCETADIFDVEAAGVVSPHELYKNVAPAPVAKMAERVRLRRTTDDKHITGGTDLTSSGHFSTEMAEHLVSDMLIEPLVSPDIVASSRFQSEVQRLQKKVEHLKVQNSVLTLTLAESKEHCDHLFLLCGKYESNAVALQQALNVTDRAIEAYDVMLALLESKLNLLERQSSAPENRRAAETVARHLLNRLNSENDGNHHENSSGPWKEIVLIDSDDNLKPWTEDDDACLRKHVSKLKGQRFTAQNTVVTLEAPFSCTTSDKMAATAALGLNSRGRSRSESRRMDLETAVLMQELLGMREDISEYKYRAEAAEREKMLSQKRLGALQEALMHLQGQLADSEALLAMATKDRSSFSEAEYAVNIERELVESLARESRLKARLQGLAGSLEAAAKNSNTPQQNTQMQNITELRETNLGLDQSLERCKKKYQAKMRKLEQQLLSLSLSNNNNNLNKSGKSEEAPETTL